MLSVFWQSDVRMLSTVSASPTNGNFSSSVVRDWATIVVIKVCRSDCFLR